MSRTRAACRLAILFALALAAASSGAAERAPLDPPILVKTGLASTLGDAGIYLAKDLGFFKEEGLDVEFVIFKAAPESIAPLATGQILVSGMSVNPALLNALNQGIALKIVADKGQVNKASHWAAIVVRKDLADRVKSFKDLKGLKIGIPARGASSFTELVYALESVGLTADDVDMVELSFPNMVVAMSNKGIDGATLTEPFITISTGQGIASVLKEVQDFYPHNAQNGIVAYSEQFPRDHPEAARRWMIAYLRGTRAYVDAMAKGTDRERVIAVLAKETGVADRALYDKMGAVGFDPNGKVDIDSMEADQNLAFKLGLIPKLADLRKAIDESYVDYAASELGRR